MLLSRTSFPRTLLFPLRVFLQLRLASGLKVRFLSADEDQQVKAIKALHKMISTGGVKGLNAVIQCGVVADISSAGLLSPLWNVRAPSAAFLMSFLTVCWSSKQMTSEMMSSLFPNVTSSHREVSMVVDHAKVLFASTIGSNSCHTTEPLVRMVPSAAPLTDTFGPCSQSENTLIQCRPSPARPCTISSDNHLPLLFFFRITSMMRGGYNACNQRRAEVTVNIAAAAAIDLKRQVGAPGESTPKSSADARRAATRA
jgi:hypothetical protein